MNDVVDQDMMKEISKLTNKQIILFLFLEKEQQQKQVISSAFQLSPTGIHLVQELIPALGAIESPFDQGLLGVYEK